MEKPRSPLPTLLVVLLVLGGFAVLLWSNAAPAVPISPVIPTQVTPTEAGNRIASLLESSFGDSSTPLPTVAIPTLAPVLPTVERAESSPAAVSAADLGDPLADTAGPLAATPTPPPPTPTQGEAGIQVTVEDITLEPVNWLPPPLIPPFSRDPLGRDHYWLLRPVQANVRGTVLSFYSYGSDGIEDNWRVHHGIDLGDKIGETVVAAGSGRVTWAADGRLGEGSIFQNSPAYGNVIVIKHDFGYRGRPIYTLYAHLQAALVQAGDIVQQGQAIGLVGNTGRVTGPHVHFEVRLGEDPRLDDDHRYGDTYNPILWISPFVGHGVIAGRVVDANGRTLDDVPITVRNWATGLQEATTTSYVFLNNVNDVNPDPVWQENFAVPDVPVGRYDVIAVIDGQRVLERVDVVEGTTSFVELRAPTIATAEPETTSEAGTNDG